MLSGKTNPRYAYMAPTYRQAKNVAWDYIKHFAGGIPNVKFHETELRCDLPTGARISLLGAENPDSLRGIYLDGCVMDEVADMPENVFPEVLRPALSDRKGFCIFVGTPKGTMFSMIIMNRLRLMRAGYRRCIRLVRLVCWIRMN